MAQVYGQTHHHCQSCNTFEFPTSIQVSEIPIFPQGKDTNFQCPKCVLPLEVGLIQSSMQVCFCNNCRGFVMPSQSLGLLINDLRSEYKGADDKPFPIDPAELDKFDNCPACLEKMDSHPYYGPGNVVLNTCNACKLAWLDHGELAKIIRAPGPRPNQPRVGNYESQALREQFAIQAKSGLGKFFS
jgi:Zn-finger nucleic acid-binding protein